VSNFRVAQWIPKYLRWYQFAFGPKLTAAQVRAHAARHQQATSASPAAPAADDLEQER
jgi:hypothetical protein